jgi:hypothetical protein
VDDNVENAGGWLITGLITVLAAYFTIKGLYNTYRQVKKGRCACPNGYSCRDCPEAGKYTLVDADETPHGHRG